jgi:hypothetical protein
MPRRGGRHQVLVKGAEKAMEQFKLEIAADLGLAHLIDDSGSYKQMTTLQVGQIGGEMVRRIQAAGEFAIMQRYQEGNQQLMPEEVMPNRNLTRNVSNNGNPTPHHEFDTTNHVMNANDTGQNWQPGNNDMTRIIAQQENQDGPDVDVVH